MSDHCPHYQTRGRAFPGKRGPTIIPRCEMTSHPCLRSNGTGYQTCGPYLAAQHKGKRLEEKAKAAINTQGRLAA